MTWALGGAGRWGADFARGALVSDPKRPCPPGGAARPPPSNPNSYERGAAATRGYCTRDAPAKGRPLRLTVADYVRTHARTLCARSSTRRGGRRPRSRASRPASTPAGLWCLGTTGPMAPGVLPHVSLAHARAREAACSHWLGEGGAGMLALSLGGDTPAANAEPGTRRTESGVENRPRHACTRHAPWL